ncbi:hypothetical protein [Curtobacterium sp. ISL-83]|uniref:hypothetical protein n=1 Tax=Curtobacterium sp. ISL-83 TaxID=2819145 RepID=UPI001BE8A315|nr:hypothetical protein [Curtobacterium sp. ISL-83]MBT2503626.1 hypothetical protein [Curtobacterium sp. ISL-83]
MDQTDPQGHDEPSGLTPATAAAFDADVPGVAIAPGGEFLPDAEVPPAVVHAGGGDDVMFDA